MPSEPSTFRADVPRHDATIATAPTSRRRTWPQRLTIALIVLDVARLLRRRGRARRRPMGRLATATSSCSAKRSAIGPATTPDVVVPGETRPTTAGPGSARRPRPRPTFPPADPEAQNFLITGADNNSCVDPDSPYAGAFGDRTNFGERSDTIMVWRVDPSTDQVAVLSFPRDLYVTVDGGSKARINSAYRRDDPSRLQDTIFLNFQIPIDHYIQVDFCAFKRLVDGVGGVKVPFEYPARDTNTGLDVPASGGECFEFDGDHALAYVRSRHYEYLVDGEWKTDGTSDFGRISRQQDFLRRTVASLLGRGPFSPSVATALLQTNREYLDDRHRAHGRPDARVRGRAALARPERDRVVPDRVDLAERVRPVRPDPADEGREHAGDPRHLPRRGAARRGARSGLRIDDERGAAAGRDDRRRRRPPRRRRRRRSGRRRTRSGSRRRATSPC